MKGISRINFGLYRLIIYQILISLPFLLSERDLIYRLILLALILILLVRPVSFPSGASKKVIGLVAVVFFSFSAFLWGGLRGVEIGSILLSQLSTLKLMEANGRRDIRVYLLISSLFFFSQVMQWFSLWIFPLVLTQGIFIFHSLKVIESGEQKGIGNKNIKDLMRGIFSPGTILFLLFFISLLAFFPRFNLSLPLPEIQRENQAIMGFGEEFNPGNLSQIIPSDTPLFRAMIVDDEFRFPSLEKLYWRGNIYRETSGFDWRNAEHRPLRQIDDLSPTTSSLNLRPLSRDKMPLFHLYDTIFVKTDGTLVAPREGMIFINESPNRPSSWELVFGKPYKDPPDQNDLSYPEDLKNDARFLEILSLFSGADPEEIVENVSSFFEEGSFAYSLVPGTYPDGKDGVLDFLFDRKIGFCEHYAAVAAILLRAKGVPSRLVVGLMGGDYNPFGGFYTVTTRHAHAWVEYWSNNKWNLYDPTLVISPERGRVDMAEFSPYREFSRSFWTSLGIAQRLTAFYYKVEFNFLHYDLNRQRAILLKMIKIPVNKDSVTLQVILLLIFIIGIIFFSYIFFFYSTRPYDFFCKSWYLYLNRLPFSSKGFSFLEIYQMQLTRAEVEVVKLIEKKMYKTDGQMASFLCLGLKLRFLTLFRRLLPYSKAP